MSGEEIRNEISFNSSFIYGLIIILTIMYENRTISYYIYNNIYNNIYYVFLLINIIGLYFICNRIRFEINISIKKI